MTSKPKINFIERNRQNIGQRKLSGKPSTSTTSTTSTASITSISSQSIRRASRPVVPAARVAPEAASKDQAVEKSAARRSQISVPPPTSAAARRPKTSTIRKLREEETDLVTKMIRMNLLEQLLGIFLAQDSETLTACREVCKSWNRYFRNVFWRENRVRNELLRRLENNWRNKRYYKVELEITSGIGCKLKCKENFRDCRCGERLECEVYQDDLVLEFGGDHLTAEYSISDHTAPSQPSKDHSSLEEKFGLEHFQLRFSLKTGLKLEMKNWLSSPVFLKRTEGTSLKVSTEVLTVEKHPGDSTMILIREKESGNVMSRVKPFSPQTRGRSGEREEVLELKCHNRWLAVNLAGCVHVYSLELLSRGNSAGALVLVANQEERERENVHYFYISDNFLLTVSNSKVTLYDFWKYKMVSNVKDFIL